MNTMSAEEYRRMIAGARSRIAGQTFEDQITASLVWHEERGILKAAKTPEPMKPIGPKQKGGRFTAVYVKAAQVDFSGTMRGGRSVRFEAKQTDTDRFERKRLTDEQMDDLRGHEKLGALCFVICCFGFDHFYRVPWRIWDNMKATFGRQYVTEADLQDYRIPYTAGVIKILSGIVKPEAGEAMMKAMHDADEIYQDTPIEEFKELWDKGEYEAPGVYTIQLEKVEIVRIVTMEGYIDKTDKAAAEDPAEEGGTDEQE